LRFNTLHIASKRYIDAYYYDPILVPNGCLDQKMDHFPWSIPPTSCSFWLAFWLEYIMVILEVGPRSYPVICIQFPEQIFNTRDFIMRTPTKNTFKNR
jgi:hypothetical protein